MSEAFLDWLQGWFSQLKVVTFAQIEIDPSHTALVSVDMIKGFCSVGSLSSPRVQAIVPAVIDLFYLLKSQRLESFLLLQDAHTNQCTEFEAFPAHCVQGSEEAETIEEIAKLPFFKECSVVTKNSLSPAYLTEFDIILNKKKQIDTFIIVGNCTDLCVYSLAMHLRLSANANNTKRRIIIPENCTATYDLSVQKAKEYHVLPHEADLLHKLFLYHMQLNGVEVLKQIHA